MAEDIRLVNALDNNSHNLTDYYCYVCLTAFFPEQPG